MTRLLLVAGKLTVGYDSARVDGQYRGGVLLERFPSTNDDDDVLIVGTPDGLRDLADAIAGLADDMDEDEEAHRP